MRDTLFQIPQGPFEFNQEVTTVFDDMISRSVPFYTHIQEQLVSLCHHFSKPNTHLYDLGCSTGTTLSHLTLPEMTLIGIDASEPMLEKARKKCPFAHFINQDLNKPLNLENPQIVILNLCLQFIKPERRLSLITEIYQQLISNGILIIIEKIIPENAENEALFEKTYHHFKSKQGYSQEEIKHKKSSLETILTPWKPSENITLLKNAGFQKIETFFQWYSFLGIFAVK